MSYVKIMLHCVWSTKKRIPFLDDTLRLVLFEHIQTNAKAKGIFIDTIGGEKDHVHCLISLGKDQNISKVIQLIKGESSFWTNRHHQKKILWQDDYFAVSVSESQLNIVRNYIRHQEEHHKRKTFDDEYSEFIRKYSFCPEE